MIHIQNLSECDQITERNVRGRSFVYKFSRNVRGRSFVYKFSSPAKCKGTFIMQGDVHHARGRSSSCKGTFIIMQGDVHHHARGRSSVYKFSSPAKSQPCSLAIRSPRWTAILAAGWLIPSCRPRAVTEKPSSRTAQ
jgi:hypothetical protein